MGLFGQGQAVFHSVKRLFLVCPILPRRAGIWIWATRVGSTSLTEPLLKQWVEGGSLTSKPHTPRLSAEKIYL